MLRFDDTALANACRDERGIGHHILQAYAEELRTSTRFACLLQIANPISRSNILA